MLIVLVLLATVVMRLAIVTVVVYLLLPRGPACPRCGEPMLPLRNRFFDHLVRALERRWCLGCGWDGVVRRGAGPPPTDHSIVVMRRAARS
jgi:hypothetical protein